MSWDKAKRQAREIRHRKDKRRAIRTLLRHWREALNG